MATVVNDRDISLQNTSPRLIATSVAVSASGAEFTKTKNGGPVLPSTISLEAEYTVFTLPTIVWEYALSTDPTTWISAGSGTPLSLTGSTIAGLIGSATSIQYRVTATQSGFLPASNTFTLTYVKEADEPIIVSISRTATAIPVDVLMVPTSYASTGTVISVRRGTTDLTYNASTGANTFYISGASVYPPTSITLDSTPTGSGTTYTYDDITHMNSADDSAVVTYTVVCRDASGIVITPSFTVEQTFTKVAGNEGSDAYHIRLDNESRIVSCDYNGTVKAGTFPMYVSSYITKGGVDITTGYSVVYSINSVAAATASVNSSTGVITVTAISADTAYVEVKADILLPDAITHLYEFKKLFLHKVKDGALAASIKVSADYANYAYVDAAATTSTSAHTVINFTATVSGITPEPTVVWSATAYNTSGVEIAGAAALFSFSGNTATMTPAQFGARGNPSTRYVIITASYNSGFQTMRDMAIVYRLDGTGDYGIDTTQNFFFTYRAETDGSVTATELAKESCTIHMIRLTDNADVTSGWQFSVSATVGTAHVNGSTSPYTAATDPVIITMASIPTGTSSGTITITATKATFPTTIQTIKYEVIRPISDGYTHYFDPKTEIVLEVNPATGAILSYADAFTFMKVLKSGVDDTSNWTFTKTDGPGVTSTLSAP